MNRLPASAFHHDVLRAVAAQIRARSYLEVGVQDGASLAVVLDAAPDVTRLVLCDTWDKSFGGTGRGSHAHIEALLQRRGWAGAVTYLDGRSQQRLPTFRAANPLARFDLVNVDGEHTVAGAGADLEHGWAVCRRVLVAHDIEFPEVWRAVLAFGRAHGSEFDGQVYFGGHGTAVFLRRKGAA